MCLRNLALSGLMGALGVLAVPTTVAQAAPRAQDLPPPVAAALARAKVPRDGLVAVVAEVGSGRARLSYRADEPVNPASLMKLVTTYAGLELLGPAYTWPTQVFVDGGVHDGVLDGRLILKGSGDPKLVVERLWLLLRRVQALGIREIRGDIVLDNSLFRVPEADPGEFDGEPLRPYNAQPDALLINFKSVVLTFLPDPARSRAVIVMDPPLAEVRADVSVPLAGGACNDWRAALKADFADPLRIGFRGAYPAACGEQVWPVAYADPKHYAARAVAGLWREMGGRLGGRVREGQTPAGLTPVFEWSSPPLAEIVRDINKYSNNIMAQQLFYTLGAATSGTGTPDSAREAIRAWATERLGSADTDFHLDNGSGLSRESRATAQWLAGLLQAAHASPIMPELMSSLPVTGVDGTLRRVGNSATVGSAHLKTGSLRGVAGIAGFVLGESGRRYVLVAIVNHRNASGAKPVLEALLEWTVRDQQTPKKSPRGSK